MLNPKLSNSPYAVRALAADHRVLIHCGIRAERPAARREPSLGCHGAGLLQNYEA